jgi:hypothetical protein
MKLIQVKRGNLYVSKTAFLLLFIIIVGIFIFIFRPESKNDIEIINVHEHIQSSDELARLEPVMEDTYTSQVWLLGSPKFTIYGSGGFTEFIENNRVILDIAKSDPKKYKAFCTISPAQTSAEAINELEYCKTNGATGVKLYNANGVFYIDVF